MATSPACLGTLLFAVTALTFAMGPVHLDAEGEALRAELARCLGERLAREVVVVATPTYAELALGMSAGNTELAWMSPALFVRSESGGRIRLVAAVERSHGEGYRGVLFVPAESTVEKAEDLAGARVAWVDRDSCAGHLFVRLALRQMGLEPSEFFGEERFVGSHGGAVRAVIQGEVDCAATHARTKPGTDEVMFAAYHPYARQRAMRPIVVSPAIPPDVICASAQLDPDALDDIRQVLLHLHETHGELVDEVFSGPRLVGARTVDYDPVRVAMQ